MKLKRLNLTAVGPFTDRTLTFNSSAPGLHIIYGPNEAGKSSSLRALKALLYGFHPQTPDNFIHSYDKLLVGGCLENSSGEEICFQRRKKRIHDIIDEAGNPLDAAALSPFLLGLEPRLFESLYGIDHDTLVKGGKDILAQKGEVGKALFAAGAGISSLREVIDHLDKDALGLFKRAGQLPEINKAVKRFNELKKEARALSLSAKDWTDQLKAKERAQAERDDLEKERTDKEKNLHRLERLSRAIPELALLKSRQDQLAKLGTAVPLPPDFEKRYRDLGEKIRAAQGQLQKDKDRRAMLEKKRREISLDKEILTQAEQIDDFHQRLGEYRKGQKDRPERNGMRISLRREAAHLLGQVRPDLTLDQVETLRPMLARKRTVQALSARYEAIEQQLKQAAKKVRAAKQEQKAVEKDSGKIPPVKLPADLVQAVKPAQKAGDLDAQLEKLQRETDLNKKNCLAQLRRIGIWEGDLKELMALSLPLSETVQHFENRHSDIADEKKEIQKERRDIEKELSAARAEMKKAASGGEVPSEKTLVLTREKREQGWQLLRRQWLDNADVTRESRQYDDSQALPEAYEKYVGQADFVADRLRREADRVARAHDLRVRIETLEALLTDNDRDKKQFDVRVQDFDRDWKAVWQPLGIIPLTPKEMGGWLAEMDKLRFKVDDIEKKEPEISRYEEKRRALKTALEKALDAMGEKTLPGGETLNPVLVMAEGVLEQIEARKTARDKFKERESKAKKDLHQADEDLKTAGEALSDWQAQWQKAISGLGVKGEVSPLEATDFIETLQTCFAKIKEAEDLKKRINGIDRDADDLTKAVKIMLEKIAPELLTLPLDQAVLQLRTLLGQAQKNSTLHAQLSKELDDLGQDLSEAEKTLEGATGQMDELLAIARCEKPEEVAAVIVTCAEHQQVQEKISETKTTLTKIGSGLSIEELSRQASEINVDELPGRTAALKTEIEDRINPEINRISQVIGEENAKLAAMDGSARAAETAEKMEQELAGIRRLAERYVQVKIASKILAQEIERYREEHQDPVLTLASAYFKDLTTSSFVRLHTDVDDKGEAILVGVRPDNARLIVDKMSSGTRDQLYLALRLATLQWRLETSEPMPFIVDDILINFDDDRSIATLKALAALSEKNQVILFTHHRRIVETAETINKDGVIEIHRL